MAISRGITITGMDEVLRNLAAYGENTRQAAATALFEEARAVEAESLARYVPVDTGQLRRDHAFVDESAKIEGDRVSIEFGYRGPYAASVHENPRAGKTGGVSPSGRKYRHWATVGQWKFLETPLLEAEKGMLSRLAGRIRDVLGGKLSATFYGG
jgi:hypothetical protein